MDKGGKKRSTHSVSEWHARKTNHAFHNNQTFEGKPSSAFTALGSERNVANFYRFVSNSFLSFSSFFSLFSLCSVFFSEGRRSEITSNSRHVSDSTQTHWAVTVRTTSRGFQVPDELQFSFQFHSSSSERFFLSKNREIVIGVFEALILSLLLLMLLRIGTTTSDAVPDSLNWIVILVLFHSESAPWSPQCCPCSRSNWRDVVSPASCLAGRRGSAEHWT